MNDAAFRAEMRCACAAVKANAHAVSHNVGQMTLEDTQTIADFIRFLDEGVAELHDGRLAVRWPWIDYAHGGLAPPRVWMGDYA